MNSKSNSKSIERWFQQAAERYAEFGVDARAVIKTLRQFSISIHCWQGDDVRGFEGALDAIGGGLAVTGNYPGSARNARELRDDLDQALQLIPGKHRINLHASYGEFGGKKVDRDAVGREHLVQWLQWARARGLGVDFNPTYFAHPLAASGFTLAHQDKSVRRFWIEHGKRCREIGAWFGKELATPCVTNFWVPDGFKDTPADRNTPRERLAASLDEIFQKPIPPKFNLDAVEPKLFGLGSESYVVGSHEFYLGYAITRKKLLCLDAGHYHPTESIADKISALIPYVPEILLHVSRGVRWDSDHVVTFTDDLLNIAREVIPHRERIHLGLDYFDASINRVAAWVIGTRALLKALLHALLQPVELLRRFEKDGDFTARLALQEASKCMPSDCVWDQFCAEENVPPGYQWLEAVRKYEAEVLSKRGA